MTYITDDELVEITPKSIRLRKRWLDPNERKKREPRAGGGEGGGLIGRAFLPLSPYFTGRGSG